MGVKNKLPITANYLDTLKDTNINLEEYQIDAIDDGFRSGLSEDQVSIFTHRLYSPESVKTIINEYIRTNASSETMKTALQYLTKFNIQHWWWDNGFLNLIIRCIHENLSEEEISFIFSYNDYCTVKEIHSWIYNTNVSIKEIQKILPFKTCKYHLVIAAKEGYYLGLTIDEMIPFIKEGIKEGYSITVYRIIFNNYRKHTDEERCIYLNKTLQINQMREIAKAIGKVPDDIIKRYAKPNISPREMRTITSIYKHGMTLEETIRNTSLFSDAEKDRILRALSPEVTIVPIDPVDIKDPISFDKIFKDMKYSITSCVDKFTNEQKLELIRVILSE